MSKNSYSRNSSATSNKSSYSLVNEDSNFDDDEEKEETKNDSDSSFESLNEYIALKNVNKPRQRIQDF